MNPAIGSESYLTKPASAVRLDTKTENRRFLGLSHVFLLLLSFSFVSPVSAQIAFVKTIGTAATTTTGTSTTITVPASGVAAGNSIIISFAADPVVGAVTCSDSAGNTYNFDNVATNGSGTSGVRVSVLSARNILPLTSGNTITCSHSSVGARALSANEFAGLAAPDAKDRTNGTSGDSTAPSVNTTFTTTQAQELLIGAIGVEGKSSETFTPGSGYTTIGRVGTNSGNATNNITVNPEYRIVNTTGVYTANGTLGNSRKWAALVVTYKKALPTRLAINLVNGGINPQAGIPFSVVVQSQDGIGRPQNVTNATAIGLTLKTGTGTLGGTLTGTITAGTNETTITGVTYTKAAALCMMGWEGERKRRSVEV